MDKIWILVAHRAGARIFRRNNRSAGLQLVEELLFPDGKLKTQEINSDRPGRNMGSAADGSIRHGFSSQVQPDDKIAKDFAKMLSQLLEKARLQNSFSHLILASDPHFLGMIKGVLSKSTEDKVFCTLSKDLSWVKNHDIPNYLHEVLARFDSSIETNQVA